MAISQGNSAKVFVFLTLTWFLILGGSELVFGRSELQLFFNTFHGASSDFLFSNITQLGSGWAALTLSLCLLFINIRWALILGLGNGLMALIVQIAKRTFFSDILRPTAILPNQLYIPPGVEIHTTLSFPSGHAATAFCLGMCLALFLSNRKLSVIMFLISALVAYSRIYLNQHFAGDVAVGSIIGMSCAWISYKFLSAVNAKWMNNGLLRK